MKVYVSCVVSFTWHFLENVALLVKKLDIFIFAYFTSSICSLHIFNVFSKVYLFFQKWKYEKHMRKFHLEYLLIRIKNTFFYENELRHFCKFYLEYLLITTTFLHVLPRISAHYSRFLHILPRISAHLGNKILNSRNSELRLQAYSSNPVEKTTKSSQILRLWMSNRLGEERFSVIFILPP